MLGRTRNGWVLALIVLATVVGLALLVLGQQPAEDADSLLSSTALPDGTDLVAATLPPAPSSTPGPYIYAVRPGDTLVGIATQFGVALDELIAANGLSDPNVLAVGQELVIPGLRAPAPRELPTPMPVPALPATPLPTPTTSGPPIVEIDGALAVGDPATESVQVGNRGGATSLENWTLSDSAGNRFTFPRLILFPGSQVTIHSASGQSTPLHLYWGRSTAAWESGELVTLRDQHGTVVDTCIVP